MNDRREQDAAIADLHRRMDDHEKLIKEPMREIVQRASSSTKNTRPR
ncbi:MAG: hypothetical protein IPL29_02550 [Propionivibrio sp.]|nr:hypothetical protein [Propionivibrio sp.]